MEIENYFSAQVFFIILRETLESAIIMSVLLAFLKQSLIEHSPSNYESIPTDDQLLTIPSPHNDVKASNLELYKKLRIQIWLGSIAGLGICTLIGGSFILLFYFFQTDIWSKTEHYWEGILSIFASIIIPIMGIAMLRIEKLQDKWRIKLSNMLLDRQSSAVNTTQQTNQTEGKTFVQFSEKYALFFLPFITILREGLEAIVFVAGIGVNSPPSSIPLSFILGMVFGIAVGVVLYKTGNSVSLKIFLIFSTCFLYLVAAGLFSKGVWQLELQHYINLCNGQDMSEVGSGPGSYDITHSVWHVNCCNGEIDGGWMMFTLIFGWTNSATYLSVSAYIIYWTVVVFLLRVLQYEEQHGLLPLIPLAWQRKRVLKRLDFQNLSANVAGTRIGIHDIVTVNSNVPLMASQ